MIRYALACDACDHQFEAWFASSGAYDTQAKRRLIECPDCAGRQVKKQIMAPAVKASSAPATRLRAVRKHIADHFDYVGADFADAARAMYYGEAETRPIWGETTPDESAALRAEGVPALPLPGALAPRRRRRKAGPALN
jgi:hypothetical protein